jgi:hypothetical protein
VKRLLFLLALFALCACRRTPSVPTTINSSAFPDQPPVVAAKPVDTASFDTGYQAGYTLGTSAATPRASVPSEEEVTQLANEMVNTDTTHNAKWHRGWVSGYLEGFRARALQLK